MKEGTSRKREKLKDEDSDIVPHNKKYILGLHPYSWHRVPKILNFLNDKSHKGESLLLFITSPSEPHQSLC